MPHDSLKSRASSQFTRVKVINTNVGNPVEPLTGVDLNFLERGK
jgi:hypothetical protein